MAEPTFNEMLGFRIQDGKLMIDVRDIEIEGLLLPKFSWGWIGLSASYGSLMGVGSFITRATFRASERQCGTALSDLAACELQQFLEPRRGEMSESEQRKCIANTREFLNMLRDYEEEANESRTHYLLNGFAETLYGLWQLGFAGYRTYMALAILRLAILRERIRRTDNQTSLRANAESYFSEVRGFHLETIKYLNELIASVIDGRKLDACAWEGLGDTRSPASTLKEMLVLGLDPVGVKDFATSAKPLNITCGNPTVGNCPIQEIMETSLQPSHNQLRSEHRDDRWEPLDWNSVKARIERNSTAIGELLISATANYDYDSPPARRSDVIGVA